MPLVIVHGGGREIDASLARAGIEKRQVDGLRITDEPTLDVVVGVLAGLVNTRFVAALCAAGVRAVGLTGADAGIGRVKAAAPHRSTKGEIVDLGRVGEPIGRETPALLVDLCRNGYVPVVSSIGASRRGLLFNVNADTLAAHLAGRLRSPRLIIAGATAGVLDRRWRHDRGCRCARRARARQGWRRDRRHGRQARRLPPCSASGAREVFVADGKDLAGLGVLARHGRVAGAAKSTRIHNGKSASRRKVRKNGIMSQQVRDLESKHIVQTYRRTPIVLVRGKGVRVFDEEGRSYLDLLAGIGVGALGHGHEGLSRAIAEQSREMIHCSNLFFHPLQGQVAERLATAVWSFALLLLQQRGGGGRSLPEVRAALLVHEGVDRPDRDHRHGRRLSRPDARRPVDDLRRTLPDAVRAAAAERAVRACERSGRSACGRVDEHCRNHPRTDSG